MNTTESGIEPSQVNVKTVAVVTFTVLGILALGWLFYTARVTVLLLLAAGLVAVALNHGVDFLQKHRWKRGLSLGAVLIGFLGLLAGFAFLIIPAFVNQAKSLVDDGPAMVEKVKQTPFFRKVDQKIHIQKKVDQLSSKTGEIATASVDPALKAVGGVVSAIAALITFIFFVIFMLLFGGRLVRGLMLEATAERRARYERVLRKLYQAVGGYVSGLSMISGLNATFATTFLAINKTPFWLPLGILSGVSTLVPYVGPTLTGAVITVISFATGGLWHGVATAVYFTIYGQIEGNIIQPVVYRRTIDVNPLVTLVTVLVAADVAGIPGAVLAVPAAATVQILLKELLQIRRERLHVPAVGDVARAQNANLAALPAPSEPDAAH